MEKEKEEDKMGKTRVWIHVREIGGGLDWGRVETDGVMLCFGARFLLRRIFLYDEITLICLFIIIIIIIGIGDDDNRWLN